VGGRLTFARNLQAEKKFEQAASGWASERLTVYEEERHRDAARWRRGHHDDHDALRPASVRHDRMCAVLHHPLDRRRCRRPGTGSPRLLSPA
jgi:hypothetical protein